MAAAQSTKTGATGACLASAEAAACSVHEAVIHSLPGARAAAEMVAAWQPQQELKAATAGAAERAETVLGSPPARVRATNHRRG